MPKGVYSRPDAVSRFERQHIPEPNSGCWLWAGSVDSYGYGQLSLGAGQGLQLAHRFSWRLHKGEIPDRLHVLHSCDNPGCVNPGHLFLGTHADNMGDMALKRRGRPGSTRLSLDQVQEIRQASDPQIELARRYGVGPSHISKIKSNRKWKHAGG